MVIDDDERDFEAVFAELRERFRRRLPDMATELAATLELCGGPDVPAAERATAPDRLQRTAHSLAGQGGTFGYPEISVAAADLEDTVVALHGSGSGVLTDPVLARLRESIGALLRIAARC